MNSKHLIVTVGISILENGNFSYNSRIRRKLERCADQWQQETVQLEKLRKDVKKHLDRSDRTVSAETESIIKIYQNIGQIDLQVYLLATDTIASYFCCEMIEYFFSTRTNKYSNIVFVPVNPENCVVEGLQVEDQELFIQKGVQNLVEKVSGILVIKKKSKDIRLSPENVILNISGGYKALIPIISLLGQLERISVQYLYKDNNQIIEIPELPIDFDWSLVEELVPFLNDFYLEKKSEILNNFPRVMEELERRKLIYEDNNKYYRTAIGTLFYNIAERRSPISFKSTLSYIVEYKMDEFYRNNPFHHNMQVYPIVKHSIELPKVVIEGKSRHSEIDLLLQSAVEISNLHPYGCMEVKSIGSVMSYKSLQKLKNQLHRQVKLLQYYKKQSPTFMGFLFYQLFDGVNCTNSYLIKQCEQLKREADKHDIQLYAFLMTIQTTNTTNNPYANFLSRELKPGTIRTIPLN